MQNPKSWLLAYGLLVVACLTVRGLPVAAEEATRSVIVPTGAALPSVVSDFTLRDYRGQEITLASYQQDKVLVLAIVGTECPLATRYAPRLALLAHEYAPRGVVFLGLDANAQDSVSKITVFAQKQGIEFPIVKDLENVVADELGARRTPEVLVIDRDRHVRYRGRIDDQFVVGRQRPAATRNDLRLALDELLAGKAVSVAQTEPLGCLIGRAPRREESDASAKVVNYAHDVAPILAGRCVHCHRTGEVAPFPLTSYDNAVGWAGTIREVVHDGRMPPWFANPEHGTFKNDARLSSEEKQRIDDWIDAGCPSGNLAEAPPLPKFTEGWQIAEPSQVIYMRPEAFTVPAQGVMPYQYFLVDPGFKEDKYIQAAEARPDNRAVVHHVVASFIPPGARPRPDSGQGGLVGFAPGMPPVVYPQGTALVVPAGSKILFQVHYTTNGTEQHDRSSIGLVFADPATVKHHVVGGMIPNAKLAIPPGDANHEVVAALTINQDLKLLTLTPHMHLRGKAFRYDAEYPDGRHETLLDIPHYDFGWQLRYDFAEPKLLPKGTRLICTAHYDNSAENVANPDPTKTVRWGDQTWEEMMIGYYSAIPAE